MARPAPLLPALLALALLAPAAGSAAPASGPEAVAAKVRELFDAWDNPVFGDLLSQERSHGAPIVLDAAVPDGSNAIFDPKRGQVLLSSKLIEINDRSLAECGLSEDRRTWVLAVQLLPTVAHEQRHAYTKWRLQDDLGRLPSTTEEEIAGFTNTIQVYEALRFSDLFKDAYQVPCATTYAAADYKVDKAAWGSASDGVEGLTRFLAASPYYSRMCSLRSDAETCRRAAEREAASAQGAERDDAAKLAAFWTDDSKVAKARKYFETVEFARTRQVFARRKPLP